MERTTISYPMGTIDLFPFVPGEYEDDDDSVDSFRYQSEDVHLFGEDAATLCWDEEEDEEDLDSVYLRCLSEEVLRSAVKSIRENIANFLISGIVERCLEETQVINCFFLFFFIIPL